MSSWTTRYTVTVAVSDAVVAAFGVCLVIGLGLVYVAGLGAGAPGYGVLFGAVFVGMALGGWMTGEIFDRTGSYRLAFLNGIAWNLMNGAIAATLLWRAHLRGGSGGGAARTAMA